MLLEQLLASATVYKFVDLCLWTEVDFFCERLGFESEDETRKKLLFFEWYALNIYYPTLAWPPTNEMAYQLCTFPEFLDEKKDNKLVSTIYTNENFFFKCQDTT